MRWTRPPVLGGRLVRLAHPIRTWRYRPITCSAFSVVRHVLMVGARVGRFLFFGGFL